MTTSSYELLNTKLVIADDSVSMLAHLSELVEQNIAGCDTVQFTDSLAALDYCLSTEVDLVVVDYVIPPFDGLEFIERFRRAPMLRDIPIIMVTNQDHAALRYKALQLGATDFVKKPVDALEFVTRIRNLLSLSYSRSLIARRADWLAVEVRKATSSIVEREREAILFLCRAAEYRDPETAMHLKRMATYARLIAQTMGLDEETVELIYGAAPMHDIGKIGIPDHILLKAGRLTPEEMEVMKRHTTFGADILAGSASPLLQLAAVIALSHHERFDGTGYPHGLAGEKIPLAGRIVALADVFDALTSRRPYKQAWSLERAREHITAECGTHFDPVCTDALFSQWSVVEKTAMANQE
ncbi:MAG TPA: HD domain-containing phosphohydrolase [Candidatus Sulfotelmatobacter sp.]|nr:HD domain-containing phosphohydrolase [Candidatus Sulfotelmatobacter sp.]